MYWEISFIAVLISIVAIICAVGIMINILFQDGGNKKMKDIAKSIREGSAAYLHRQYLTVLFFAILIFLILAYTIPKGSYNNGLLIAAGFLAGAIFSAIAGYLGMNIASRANVRTAQAVKTDFKKGLRIAFKGGSVGGITVVGLSLLGVSGLYFICTKLLEIPAGDAPNLLIGFVFGTSLISLFARLGGGIYETATDIGVDLLEKNEKGISSTDPRNPAAIADDVGDNVGDCAGMSADLFETYAITLIATMILAASFLTKTLGINGIEYPLALGATGIIASIAGTFFVRAPKQNHNIMGAFYKGILATGILAGIGFYFITNHMFGDIYIFLASVLGLIATLCIGITTEYYTSASHMPVKKIAESAEKGAGTNIISGLATGFESVFLPAILMIVIIIVAYFFGESSTAENGIYGIAVAAVAMLSTAATVIAIDSYGPIADNADSIAEMAELPSKARKNTNELDTAGNTVNALTKGYAIISAALAGLLLFYAYSAELTRNASEEFAFALTNYQVLIGLFIGGIIPFLFASSILESVIKTANKVVNETKRQFKEIKGLAKGKSLPEYGLCVDVATKSALKEMIFPGILAVIAPVLVGIFLGPAALGGLSIGVIAVGFLMAISMYTSGGAWDNAKKYIENGNLGGKNSTAHKAALTGDMLGDPYKDAISPSLNSLIKIINTISLIIAPLIAGLIIWR